MRNLLIAASALATGTAVLAQAAPVAQPAPATAPAPVARPMQDKVMTRTEAVQMVRQRFGKVDADRNGIITTAEIDGLRTKMRRDFKGMRDPNAAFDRLDDNKDGAISREEFSEAREERVERRIERREKRAEAGNSPKEGKHIRRHVMRMHGGDRFAGRMLIMADTNSDGMISMGEAEALALQHFEQMDADKDGRVTPEERRAGRRLMIERKAQEQSGS